MKFESEVAKVQQKKERLRWMEVEKLVQVAYYN